MKYLKIILSSLILTFVLSVFGLTKMSKVKAEDHNFKINYFNKDLEITEQYMYAAKNIYIANSREYKLINTKENIKHDENDYSYYNDFYTINFRAINETQIYIPAKNIRYILNPGDVLEIEKNKNESSRVFYYINDELIHDESTIQRMYVNSTNDLIEINDSKALIFIKDVDNTDNYIYDILHIHPEELYNENINDELEIMIPDGFKVLYTITGDSTVRSEIGNIKVIPVKESGYNYYDIFVNETKIERFNNFSSMYLSLKIIPDETYTINIRDSNGYRINNITNIPKGTMIPMDDIIGFSRQNDRELYDYEKYNYYYDLDKVHKVENTDLIESDVTIYRFIELDNDNKIVTVNFDTNGGDNINSIQFDLSEYDKETNELRISDLFSNIELPRATKDQYFFIRWKLVGYEDYQNNILEHKIYSTNITLIAEYSELGKEIEINLLGYKKIKLLSGDKIDLTDFPDNSEFNKINQRFLGWNYGSTSTTDKSVLDLEKMYFYENITLYPKYEHVTHLNVTFNVNGGIYLAPIQIPTLIARSNFKNLLPEPEKSKSIFGGWFLDEELTIPVLDKVDSSKEQNMVYYDVTLYASWIENASKVYFHTNTSNLEISPVIITKGQRINISNPPKRTGYIFNGWFLDEELTIEYLGEEIYEDEVNLYASWLLDDDYDIGEAPEDDIENNYDVYLYVFIIIAGLGVTALIFRRR